MKLAALAGLLATSCVLPQTHARIAWNPTTGLFEGELSRSWLAGPVNLEANYRDPQGRSLSLHWTSEIDLSPSSRAYQAQSQMIREAVEAAAESLRHIPY